MGWVLTGFVVLAVVWGRLSWRSYHRASEKGARTGAAVVGVLGVGYLTLAAVQLLLER